jgi:hypothetical protein
MSYDLNANFRKALGESNFARIYKSPTITTGGATSGIRSFQDTGFIGFTGVGTPDIKQFSFGDLGTRFIDKDEAQMLGAVSDRGQSTIQTDFGKQVFNEFKTVIAQNQVELGTKLVEAKEERDRIEGSTAGGFAGLTEFIQDVQSQLGAVDKRLSQQLTQAGADITEVGAKSNGDGKPFWDNLASALGIGVPALAIGGIAALLLLRR